MAAETKERRIAVAAMLHYMSEGVAEGLWTNFKFSVKQRRTERRNPVTGRLLSAQPTKLVVTFVMEVDEHDFKADVAKRTKEVAEALALPDNVSVIDQ